jgi:hypothetical protein
MRSSASNERLKKTILELSVASILRDPAYGLRETAAEDILFRASAAWDVNDSGALVPKDSENASLPADDLGPNGLGDWVRSLVDDSPHLFTDAGQSPVPSERFGWRTPSEFANLTPVDKLYIANHGW